MLKLLILGAALVLLLWLLFGGLRRGRGGDGAGRRKSAKGDAARAEEMVACAHCGLHLPRSEALAARGLHYCSGAHRDAAPPSA